MTNSDNTFGVHNKITQILSQLDIMNKSGVQTDDASTTCHGDGSTDIGREISAITLNNPIRVTTTEPHRMVNKTKVTFSSVPGTTELNSNTYFAKKIDANNFDLYSDFALSSTINGGSGFTAKTDDNWDGRVKYVLAKTVFANTDDAKDFFLTSDAQTCFTDCATQIQWGLVNDADGNATSLKYTVAFGVKENAGTDGWGTTFNSRKATLVGNDGWTTTGANKVVGTTNSSDHLF